MVERSLVVARAFDAASRWRRVVYELCGESGPDAAAPRIVRAPAAGQSGYGVGGAGAVTAARALTIP